MLFRSLVQVGISRGETKPRTGRAGKTSHQACRQYAERTAAGVVVDIAVALLALVTVLPKVAPLRRRQVGRDLGPLRPPRCALSAELAPPGQDL